MDKVYLRLEASFKLLVELNDTDYSVGKEITVKNDKQVRSTVR